MIPSSKKKSYTQLPPGFMDQMQDTLVIKEPVEEIEPVTTSSAAEAVVEKETPAVNIKTVTKLELLMINTNCDKTGARSMSMLLSAEPTS